MRIKRKIDVGALTKSFLDDCLPAILMFLIWGGELLAIVVFFLAQWHWCWIGLALFVVALISLAVLVTTGDICDLGRQHCSRAKTLWRGLKIIAEAVCCVFFYLNIMPFIELAHKLTDCTKDCFSKCK